MGASPCPTRARASSPRGCSGRRGSSIRRAFAWTDSAWTGVAFADLVIYELHVGTFTPAGTFAAVTERLAELREMGVTAIELMPVATFPGNRNWGYDGLYTWAAHPVYGGPEGLAALVDAAHAAGVAVILDVVYNHLGPGLAGARGVRSVPHARLRHALGRRGQLRRPRERRRARVGDPERVHVGARPAPRRAARGRRARDPRPRRPARDGRTLRPGGRGGARTTR